MVRAVWGACDGRGASAEAHSPSGKRGRGPRQRAPQPQPPARAELVDARPLRNPHPLKRRSAPAAAHAVRLGGADHAAGPRAVS